MRTRPEPRDRIPCLLGLGLLGLVLTSSVGCAGAPARSVAPPPGVERRIDAVCREMERLLVAGDHAGVASKYDPQGSLIAPKGTHVQGAPAILEYWDNPGRTLSWTLTSNSLEGEGDLWVQTGRSVLVSEWEGKANTYASEFVVVWRVPEEGEPRILVDAYWATPGQGDR